MKKLVEFIISGIVDNPDKLDIVQSLNEEENTIIFDVKAAPEDMGKIIGKRGRIIKAIRNLLKVEAIKTGKRVILNLD